MDPCQAISRSRKPQLLTKLLNSEIDYAIMYLTVKINHWTSNCKSVGLETRAVISLKHNNDYSL